MHPHLRNPAFTPPLGLRSGLAMTVYTASWANKNWEATTFDPEPPYKEKIFSGAGGVPIYGWIAIPENPRSTIVGTYGITGTLDNQWFLRLLGRKAYAQGYAVVLFDWRAHGKTAKLSPTLTSDGLYEGEDFVRIAAEAKAMGCPAKFWFTGYSLGGQLALWAVKASEDLLGGDQAEAGGEEDGEVGRWGDRESFKGREMRRWGDGETGLLMSNTIPPSSHPLITPSPNPLITPSPNPLITPSPNPLITPSSETPSPLTIDEIGGAAVICPSLDSNRSLSYLVKHPVGKYLEQAIARGLKELAWQIYQAHPEAIDPAAIERANSIWGFDHELVIGRLGFPSVEAYYDATSGLHLLPNLKKPTLIVYAADDPLFAPAIVPDLQTAIARNPNIDLILTRYGGHVGYFSSKACQSQMGDPDPWWAWNRVLEWINQSMKKDEG